MALFNINSIKSYFAKNYLKSVPQEKLIVVFGGGENDLINSYIESVLNEKLSTIFISEKEGDLLPALSKVNPKIDKVILNMEITNKYLQSKAIDPSVYILPKLPALTDSFQLAAFMKKLSKDKTVIVNFDDIEVRKACEDIEAEVLFYGTSSTDCHIWPSNIKVSNFQTYFELNYGVERVELKTRQLGFIALSSMLAVSTLGVFLKLPLTTVKKGLEKIENAPHHLELVEGHNGSMIIDDSYDSDPQSIDDALEVMNNLPGRRRIIVFGEMKNLGYESEKLHREVARKLYKDKVDIVISGIGDAAFITAELAQLGFLEERMESGLQNPQIVSMLLRILSKGDLCLLKASQSAKYSEIVKKVSKPL